MVLPFKVGGSFGSIDAEVGPLASSARVGHGLENCFGLFNSSRSRRDRKSGNQENAIGQDPAELLCENESSQALLEILEASLIKGKLQ
jgi:hypothetical protein